MDKSIVNLARRANVRYSRYADDLTFSSNKPLFSSEIAVQVSDNVWTPSPTLLSILKKSGFLCNDKKVRMQYRTSRQVVTGLTVNVRPNMPLVYRKNVRAMVHSLFTEGKFWINSSNNQVQEGNIQQLHGMLSFIDYIDRRNTEKYIQRTGNKSKENAKRVLCEGRSKDYKNFLLYKYFLFHPYPLIVCEGKTDITYLKCALPFFKKNLFGLFTSKEGSEEFKYKFFKYKKGSRSQQILRITDGGSTTLAGILDQILSLWKKFKNRNLPDVNGNLNLTPR